MQPPKSYNVGGQRSSQAAYRQALRRPARLQGSLVHGVCGCCGALRPRYKRLVDNIFPEDPEDGLVKANMEKLTFYALSAPEKLDRIGAYLSERLSRDVARHKYGYVCIAMEALDQLLMACHCQSINLFVESFLKMVRKLLEADKPNLQILGTNSSIGKSVLATSDRYVCIAMEALDQLLMACHCQSINLFVESFLKMVRKLLEADKPNLQILGTNSWHTGEEEGRGSALQGGGGRQQAASVPSLAALSARELVPIPPLWGQQQWGSLSGQRRGPQSNNCLSFPPLAATGVRPLCSCGEGKGHIPVGSSMLH
ncbi:UNVERIFIED_CONTAM: hypothetical protein FKN15_021653 [Acipenser sinensis]